MAMRIWTKQGMRRLALAATFALLAGCDTGGSDTGSNGGPGGPGGPGDEPGAETQAPPASPDGLWMVPDEYAGHAGGSGGGDGAAMGGEGAMGSAADAGSYASDDDYGGGGGGAGAPEPGGEWEAPPSEEPSDYPGGNGAPSPKAGVADDNADHEAFLSYLDTNAGLPNTLAIDVSERYVLRAMAGSSTVPNARVRIEAGGKLVYEGRTLARGDVLFHPRALGVGDEVAAFDWEVTTAAGTTTGSFDRTSGGDITLAAAGPYEVPQKVRADVALVVDTTGSMGDEIAVLRDSWLQITADIAALDPNLDPRFALVVYRDRGDAFVVKFLDFTGDIQEFLGALEDVSADGGGDYPEDLQAALDTTMQYLSWDDAAPIRIAFTLADAPPQLYEQETTYAESCNRAVRRGIRTHAIAASGSDESAELVFRQLAQFTSGRFLFLTYDNDIPGKPGSGTGSGGDDGYSVEQYLTGTLDELVVKLVNLDVLALTGKPLPQPEGTVEP
jgi:hypothetical protein